MPVAPPLAERARAAADLLRDHGDRTVTVVHHIDADGVSAGAVALEALDRAGIAARPHHVRSLDDHHVQQVLATDPEMLWFCDLGSAAHAHFDVPKIVCDHHELVRDGREDFPGHVNPMLDGLPGHDVSGAGAAFLVAEALAPSCADLRPMALVGAAADLQDRAEGRFCGSNTALVDAAEAAGQVDACTDLAFYGPETRPLAKFLAYTQDRPVPGITRDRRAVVALLDDLGIRLMADGRERTWSMLDEEERVAVRSAIVNRRLDCGLGTGDLWRQVIRIRTEAPATETRELQEFGTLLNSTARYDRPDVGLAVARGDRGATFEEARRLRTDHRRNLAGAIEALARAGVQETDGLQWVHARGEVRDTVIGIVCGMALEGLGLRQDKPLVGFAHTPDGRTKVSSRASSLLQARGIDLAAAMRAAAESVGGQGGGHSGAAGATIPRGAEDAFLQAVEATLFEATTTRA